MIQEMNDKIPKGMTKEQYQEAYAKEYLKLAEIMDNQAEYFTLLLAYVQKHGVVGLSEDRKADLTRAERYIPWRDDPVALQTIVMAARKAVSMSDSERQFLRGNMKHTRKAVRHAVTNVRKMFGSMA